MTLLLKDPDAVLDYAVDWAADYLDGDALAQSEWSVSPDESGGIAVVGSRIEPGVAIVQVGGGIAGRIYRLTNHVVLVSGREDDRSIMIRVEER